MYLALDTSTRKALIALMDEDDLIVRQFDHRQTQKVIFTELANLLDPETLANLDGIAVGIGPGSFTGVKIGVIAAKSLAWSRSLPLVGISSMDAVAAGVEINSADILKLLVTVPSTRNEIYVRIYSLEKGEWVASSPIHDVSLDSEHLDRILPDGPLLIAGEAAVELSESSNIIKNRSVTIVDEKFRYPSAKGFFKLAMPRFESGNPDDPMTLIPDYVRLSQPERLLSDGTD